MRQMAAAQAEQAGGVLQRICDCSQKMPALQRSALRSTQEMAPPIVHEVLRSTGRPLDPATRADMEPRFGHDFSRVRVHADAKAAESARAVNALAYTVGRDIVFDAGRFAPDMAEGRALLMHELAHVVQQGGVRTPGDLRIEPCESRYEHEADQIASGSADGRSSAGRCGNAPAPLQRACYRPSGMRPVAGCEGMCGDITDVGTSSEELFRFAVNCDDFLAGEEARLRSFAGRLQPGDSVTIHGFASEDGPADFNEHLSCLRALRARSVLENASVFPARIAGIFKHGATPGARAGRRSVVAHRMAPPPAPTPKPAPTPLPAPRRQRPQATISAAPEDRRPREERTCFGISCTAFEHLRRAIRRELTPSEQSVRRAIQMEIEFLRRTEFRDQYRRMAPEVLLYQPIDSWGPELQKRTALLNQQVEQRARERIFRFLYEQDPTFRLGGERGLRRMINSRYAR